MDRKKSRENEYEFEKRTIPINDLDVKKPSCPVTTLKGREVKCSKRQCLWWDAEKDVCKVSAK